MQYFCGIHVSDTAKQFFRSNLQFGKEVDIFEKPKIVSISNSPTATGLIRGVLYLTMPWWHLPYPLSNGERSPRWKNMTMIMLRWHMVDMFLVVVAIIHAVIMIRTSYFPCLYFFKKNIYCLYISRLLVFLSTFWPKGRMFIETGLCFVFLSCPNGLFLAATCSFLRCLRCKLLKRVAAVHKSPVPVGSTKGVWVFQKSPNLFNQNLLINWTPTYFPSSEQKTTGRKRQSCSVNGPFF